MVKIKQQISNNNNHYGWGNKKTAITIHETDNWDYGANAQTHANLIDNGFSSTWHYSVDDKQAIQSFNHNIRCWHAGDGRSKNGGNFTSIAIEICVNRDSNYLKAVQNAIELTRKIMKDEDIPASRVYQHNHWSGKNCPRALRHGRNGITWKTFKNALGNDLVSIPTSTVDDLVKRTLAGEFGNGATRKKALGKHYDEVQRKINEKYSVKTKPKVNIDNLVKRTLAGEFGNGAKRKKALGKHYNEVQRIINKRYS